MCIRSAPCCQTIIESSLILSNIIIFVSIYSLREVIFIILYFSVGEQQYFGSPRINFDPNQKGPVDTCLNITRTSSTTSLSNFVRCQRGCQLSPCCHHSAHFYGLLHCQLPWMSWNMSSQEVYAYSGKPFKFKLILESMYSVFINFDIKAGLNNTA